MIKNAIFHIEGGLGKNIVATSVIRSYKKEHPIHNIIVNSAYPDIFQGNPDIDRCYLLGNTPYFYEDFIFDKDCEIFAHDPYKTTNHITKQQPLVKSWCDMIGINYDGLNPNIYFNFREGEIPRALLPQTDKPILIFQPFGGAQNQEFPYSWTRDIHPFIAQQIINNLKEQYTILHICHPHHPQLQNVIRYKKILCAMLNLSKKRILIDSSLQHAAAAMGLPSTVVWVGTQPEVFGYDMHNNITPPVTFPKGNINSYLYDYSFNGIIHECPYDNIYQIFNIENIIK
jgi:ADP-heptose:LPS heptosyltransferase